MSDSAPLPWTPFVEFMLIPGIPHITLRNPLSLHRLGESSMIGLRLPTVSRFRLIPAKLAQNIIFHARGRLKSMPPNHILLRQYLTPVCSRLSLMKHAHTSLDPQFNPQMYNPMDPQLNPRPRTVSHPQRPIQVAQQPLRPSHQFHVRALIVPPLPLLRFFRSKPEILSLSRKREPNDVSVLRLLVSPLLTVHSSFEEL